MNVLVSPEDVERPQVDERHAIARDAARRARRPVLPLPSHNRATERRAHLSASCSPEASTQALLVCTNRAPSTRESASNIVSTGAKWRARHSLSVCGSNPDGSNAEMQNRLGAVPTHDVLQCGGVGDVRVFDRQQRRLQRCPPVARRTSPAGAAHRQRPPASPSHKTAPASAQRTRRRVTAEPMKPPAPVPELSSHLVPAPGSSSEGATRAEA